MKNFLRSFLLLGIALLAGSTVAKADTVYGQISLMGTNTYDAHSVTFNPGTTVGYGTAYGAMSAFDSSATVQMTSFSFDPFSPVQVFKITEGSNVLTFTLSSIQDITNDANGLLIVGSGTFDMTGYQSSTGTFRLSTQPGGTGTTVTFSATAIAPTPEPNTLLMLGTGLIGSATALYRRRRTKVA